jgi:hypothetical protein
MGILEIGLETIGESILALILSLIPILGGLICIWVALYYFKTGIPYGYTEPWEEDKISYFIAGILFGGIFFSFGLFAVFAAFQGILKHYMALDLASYLACIFPILITFATILFLYRYWKKEEPTKKKEIK